MVDVMRLQEVLRAYHQTLSLSILQCEGQTYLNLMGQSEDPLKLTGELFRAEKEIKQWTKTGNTRAMFHFYSCQLDLAYYFDDLELAKDMASRLQIGIKDQTGPGVWVPSRLMFHGLVMFAVYRKEKQRSYLRKAKRIVKICENLAARGCVNMPPYVSLLRAEQAATIDPNDIGKVQKAFDLSIVIAGRAGILNIRALSNELAFKFFLDRDPLTAKSYFKQALDLYAEWGAKAKVHQLLRKHGHVLGSTREESFISACSAETSRGSNGRVLARPRFGSLSNRVSQVNVEFALLTTRY